MKKFALALGVASLIGFSAVTAEAAAVFTVEAFTATSVTFNITGDLSGYSLPSPDQFSIAYTGDLASSMTSYSSNTWSGSPLTGTTMGGGNTGNFGGTYTWSGITPSANTGSTFTGQSITVSWSNNGNTLNTAATSGDFIAYIGNGNTTSTHTEIGRVSVGDVGVVPEPTMLGMFALTLLGLGRRKRS